MNVLANDGVSVEGVEKLNQAGFKDTKVTYKTASNMVIQGRLLNN